MSSSHVDSFLHFKDEGLDSLARIANVAQFVSFDSDLKQRFARIVGYTDNFDFNGPSTAAEKLLENASEGEVNVRSYRPDSPESNPFVKGLRSVSDVVDVVTKLSSAGLYTIINERINENDGGVSGVLLGDVMEFAPNVVPRGVDDPNVQNVSMPRNLGLDILKCVYGFSPELDYERTSRVEFSIHPTRKGFRNTHTTVWEIREVGLVESSAEIRWPNDFSRKIGDKAFGLLIANLMRLPVPRTTVVSRFCAPFSFGTHTGTGEFWIRTCPVEPVPGFFTTRFGWEDPFALLQKEDPSGGKIASVLAQEGVEAAFSGALLTSVDNSIVIEGVAGKGDSFMIGDGGIQELPQNVIESVTAAYTALFNCLGPVRLEWVYDGEKTWVVQLHVGQSTTKGSVIFPGDVSVFHKYDVSKGLEGLRLLIDELNAEHEGIELVGNVGVASHFGDVLRRARIPSRILRK